MRPERDLFTATRARLARHDDVEDDHAEGEVPSDHHGLFTPIESAADAPRLRL